MKKFLPRLVLPLICYTSAVPAISDIELKLSDDRVLSVDLAEARLISELSGYAIIAGRTCIDCDENTAIFLQKIDGEAFPARDADEPPEPERFAEQNREPRDETTAMQRDQSQAEMDGDADGVTEINLSGERFSYPGRYRDYLTKKLVEKTRMFYGNCHESSPALLWLTEYRTDKGWVKEEYLLVFRDEGVEHRYSETQQPSIYYIENEGCRELPGIETTTEP
ncbi:hypothetical protein GNX18_18805 [Microbulbifer sp. SH-1]|uniref:hypothetical protein n=1 Tax=Microbulbifer sp. SH-1 TaxID=2681547 RepID=UPI001407A444|nr:hypothetical protein [Microbulbifer sp. SH-1]QIL91604.1 hypothetical protein GNX18_18805 [Microbulbifer sp. SH-1]